MVNYFLPKNGTLGERLDKAWEAYLDESKTQRQRRHALQFMTHVFDIRSLPPGFNELNELIAELMDERAAKKTENPEYIPMLYRGQYSTEDMDTHEMDAKRVANLELTHSESIERGELLSVNQASKNEDIAYGTTYFDPSERAKHRLDIRDGLLHQHGEPFDSSGFISHGQRKFVAFTLNVNNELSVFEHLAGKPDAEGRELLHSTMNSGAPVLAAGEMQIEKGKLKAITLHSGHYQPNLYNTALLIEHLSKQGIDISETKIRLTHHPITQKVELENVEVRRVGITRHGYREISYEINATDVVQSVHSVLNRNIRSINQYVSDNKTKFPFLAKIFGFGRATQKRVELAESLSEELYYLMHIAQGATSVDDLTALIDRFDSVISRYEEQNMTIKAGDQLSEKFQEMKNELQDAKDELEETSDEAEDKKREDLKKLF